MKRILTLKLFTMSIALAYAQTPVVVQDAKTTATELKIKCQTLKVAKNNCVIAHFDTSGNWSLSKKPADLYRVLNGKTADNLFVATDYHRNGQKQSDTFATPHAIAVVRAWNDSELQFTAKGYTNYRTDGSKNHAYDVVNDIGNGSSTRYYPDGSRESEGMVKNDIHDGTWTYWHENGEKRSTGIEKDELTIGQWSYWHENGKNWATGSFDGEGRQAGLWTYWYENGQKKKELFYKEGMVSGSSIFWFENGQKQKEGNYLNDHEVGKWTFWHENGEKLSQGKYANGEHDGEWQFWDESGRKQGMKVYKEGEVLDTDNDGNPAADTVAAQVAVDAAFDDAQAAADKLGTGCKKFIRADQCVIAYFDKNSQVQNRSKDAKYYRVLHGKMNDVYIIQDFYRTGQKQSDVVFARSENGILSSFSTFDLNAEGRVTGYKPNGETVFSNNFVNGSMTEDASTAAAVDAAK